MAYLDLDLARSATLGSASTPLQTDERALHRQVIALSLQDRLASVRAPGRLLNALRNIVGIPRQTRLADERLETLRRFAVLYRLLGADVAASEKESLIKAGFDQVSISRFSREIDGAVRERPDGLARLAPTALSAAAVLGLAAAFAAWLCEALDDPMIAWIVAGLVVVTLAGLLGRPVNNHARR